MGKGRKSKDSIDPTENDAVTKHQSGQKASRRMCS
jgi:hypothetical protein